MTDGQKKHLAHSIVKDTDEPEPAGMPEGELERLEVEPAQNGGFTVRHHMKPRPQKATKGETAPTPFENPKLFAFSNHADMVQHVHDATKK